jgi:DNA ligase-1
MSIEGGVMLATDFKKEGHRLKYPLLVQPKLDGMRMLYNSKTGKSEARSGNSGKTSKQTHIFAELKKLHLNEVELDGELYKKGLNFQEVMRHVNSGSGIEYWIYDYVSSEPFYERYNNLKHLFHQKKDHILKLVPCYEVYSKKELLEFLQLFEDEGYEGLIVRDPLAPYVHVRSLGLQKLKTFTDDEFKVIGYKPRVGGGVVWECETKDGKTFFANPTAALSHEVVHPNKFVGKKLTVKFFGYSENGIPRHPVAKAFRNKEDLGHKSMKKSSLKKSLKKSPRIK